MSKDNNELNSVCTIFSKLFFAINIRFSVIVRVTVRFTFF